MVNKNKKARISQLLQMAWATKSRARIMAIADQVLEIDPYNTEALMMKADGTDDADTRIRLLEKALSSLDNPESCNPEDKDMLFLVLNQRMAYTFFALNNMDRALEFCQTALKFGEDHSNLDEMDDEGAMKTLYYRIMIERRDWQKILAETLKDEDHSLAWGYARLVAAWMIAPDNGRAVCANMFWDVLMIAPDVPFYMLGYFPEPDDSDDITAHDNFEFALMFYDVVSVSDDLFRWFSRGVILFGLLSGRFDAKEREYMLDVIDTLGGYEEYDKMSRIIVEGDDAAVIEMLAANRCLVE